jgi:cytochrome bd-type quinol oxidase subunit 1
MLIAIISVLHVLVSHYAVGGGIFLAVEVGQAYRTKDREYLDYLHGHARFFVLLTVVFGAITGVGIWWTIGLSSPLATETLIRTFVFGWATEWVFFVVELVAAFIFLYCWGRLDERTHWTVGWIYALAAWISLVLITGITAFMLNSGDWAVDPQSRTFWKAFFNPQFIPQTIARTGAALMLSSLYVYLHASLAAQPVRLRRMIATRASRPALVGAGMLLAGGASWYLFLPEWSRATLGAAAVLQLMTAVMAGGAVAVLALIVVGPLLNPKWLSPGFAAALLLLGLASFSAGEFVREAVRKPFVIHNIVLGNQVFNEETPAIRAAGYLESGIWTNAFVKDTLGERHPKLFVDGQINEKQLPELPYKDRLALGKSLFMHHCNDCHAGDLGYSAVGPLLQGLPREELFERIKKLDQNIFMPPWCGTAEEARLLADYLSTIQPPLPPGMRMWRQSGGEED